MHPLSLRLRQADSMLASYAVPHGSGLGRTHEEPADATRFPFQRDRDRIIHTQSFRRLKHKTQVFFAGLPAVAHRAKAGHGDHYRTRITHTLEVAQISRDIARTLGLNEDLAEAVAIAHDLGHTPFGHAGEEAMRHCMEKFGKSFEHNEQSLRVVTLLESRTSAYAGLNLSTEILEGLMKHQPSPVAEGLRPASQPSSYSGGLRLAGRTLSLEAQIVNLSDEIAYTAHDTDDGMRAGLFSMKDIQKTKLGFLASARARERKTELRGSIVDVLVSDLYGETEERLTSKKIATLEDVYEAESPLCAFSPAMQKDLSELRDFLWDHLYRSKAVLVQAGRGQQIIAELFAAYFSFPPGKVLELHAKNGGDIEDAVKDYIAGMTDPYATAVHEAL